MNNSLSIALSAAIPLRIMELQSRGGPCDLDYQWLKEYSDSHELACKGDVLQYGSKPGEAADYFNNLARAIAIMAFCPGGITIFGSTYQGKRKE